MMLSAIGVRWRTCVPMVRCLCQLWCCSRVITIRMFLSIINCLTLDTVVTLFLFIQRSVPISYLFIYLFIYLLQSPYFYLLFIYRSPYFYLFIYLPQSTYFYSFITDRMEQHLRVIGLSARDGAVECFEDMRERAVG